MTRRRDSVRVVGVSDESVLAQGHHVIFVRSLEALGVYVPAGATGYIVSTFPCLVIQVDPMTSGLRRPKILAWPLSIDPRHVIMRLPSEQEAPWVDYDVVSEPPRLRGAGTSTMPPPG